ncbi:hypothetical protein DM860_000953 [Cuscuta australis]|uniref:DOG1 domain-containing protein n=1 Tax=Cuscuta australis TaxID=267555 RepID=A0A328DX07_9ASTE|nr:hypothetical protein DM860_000953 [Cuscuta australis]
MNLERSASAGMPSFISLTTPVSNPMATEGNANPAARTSQMMNFGMLEQYLGFRIADSSNVGLSPVLNPTLASNPSAVAGGSGILNNKDIASSINRLSAVAAMHASMGVQRNQVQGSGSSNQDNWAESNMADSSSHTDTSTDMDGDDKNRLLEMGGQYMGVAASDSSDKSKEKNLDQKTLRRLAQNREAARKSRLRKKAYVQQLENSRMKLTQLEQELKQARQQGIFISSMGDQSHGVGSNGALAFDVEYGRWLEEQNKRISELRAAVNSHAGDAELRIVVDNVTSHFDEVFKLKGNAAKSDVFHVLSGMWKSPAERCFLWIGGFRPSELLKLLMKQLEPLTEQQMAGIYTLQQSSHQAEDAISQGMEALQQSLAETLSNGTSGPDGQSGNVANYMGQMAMAMGKLGTLEGFLRQADKLRQQTLQQMHNVLTTRQSARALLVINEYFSRLRALSSLWRARPQE